MFYCKYNLELSELEKKNKIKRLQDLTGIWCMGVIQFQWISLEMPVLKSKIQPECAVNMLFT